MTLNVRRLVPIVALLLIACGGGGGGGGAAAGGGGGTGGGTGGGGTPPVTPPPPAPTGTQPQIFIERDPNGTPYVRVLEFIYDAFAQTAPQQTITSAVFDIHVNGTTTTYINGVDLTQSAHGIDIFGSGIVSIYDYSYVDFDGGGSIHGAALKIERVASAPTYIQRVFADAFEAADPNYNVSNTDFLGIEFNSSPTYVRNATGRNFGDAGVDTKSGPIHLMNVTLSGGNRMLRAWDGTEIILVNSIVNAPTNFSHAWLFDNSSTIRYHNVLWCVNVANPTPTDPNCSSTPTFVEGENITPDEARARIFELADNPLASVNPFFETEIDTIVVEYSSDGGASWQTMSLPNAGGGGLPAPVGDTRYRIPFDLNSGDYVFRASFRNGGSFVGQYSEIIDEAGQTVP